MKEIMFLIFNSIKFWSYEKTEFIEIYRHSFKESWVDRHNNPILFLNSKIDQNEVEQKQIDNYFDLSFAGINLTDGSFVHLLPDQMGVIICQQELQCELLFLDNINSKSSEI